MQLPFYEKEEKATRVNKKKDALAIKQELGFCPVLSSWELLALCQLCPPLKPQVPPTPKSPLISPLLLSDTIYRKTAP